MPKGVPPVTRTRPSASRVATWRSRAAFIEPVGLNVPVFGSYSSAEASGCRNLSSPPVIRTRPSRSRVAVCTSRAVVIEPVGPKVPVVGS